MSRISARILASRIRTAGARACVRDAVPRRDALIGLAPAPSTPCPRCGKPTSALANGRGRLDLCETCGTVEFATSEGIEVFRYLEPGSRRS